MKHDLHIHSTCSDGKYSRIELLKILNDLKFKCASFCDHNYISDDIENLNKMYIEKYHKRQQVKLITGIELDVEENSRLHILGYDIKNIEGAKKILDVLEKENTEICLNLIKKIKYYYNIEIPVEDLTKYTINRNITKNNIAQWLIDNGHANSIYEAGVKYTSKPSPCYVERSRLKLKNVFKLIKDNGGIAIMAHPSSINLCNEDLELFIRKLISYGLDGIEVFNADKTSPESCIFHNKIAEKYNLLKTSGSDFHNKTFTPILGVDNNYSGEFIKVIKRRCLK